MKTLTAIETEVSRPERRPQSASFRRIAMFLAVLLGGYIAAESLIFRTGFYSRFLEPELSATGDLERIVENEIHRPPTGRKEVLVVGNSRMAEGFSAKLANEHTSAAGYWFINLGMPATGDRAWYYMVRDIDPHHNRYAAITIMIDDFDDPDDYEDVADRVGDLQLIITRLRVTDIIPYTMSFTTWKSRLTIFRGLAFPGTVYQRDFQEFMEHPSRRLERIAKYRQAGDQYGYDYDGMDHSMAGLEVDYANHTAKFPAGMPEQQQRDLRDFFFHDPPQAHRIRDLQVRWLAPLVDMYRNSNTRIIIFQVPRSPAPSPTSLAHLSWTTVDELRKRPWVKIIDKHTFEDLEKPELFGDHVHLNHDGRHLFSPRLADVVIDALR